LAVQLMFVVTVVVIWEEPWFKDYGIGLSDRGVRHGHRGVRHLRP